MTSTRRTVLAAAAGALLVSGSTAGPTLGYPRPHEMQRVDRSSTGQAPSNDELSATPAISANGRYVTFDTDAALVPSDDNPLSDVYRRDLRTGVTELVSKAPTGLPAAGPALAPTPPTAEWWHNPYDRLSLDPTISADGRFIAFTSHAVNLVTGDLNLMPDVFVWDGKTKTIERASVSSAEAEADGPKFGFAGSFLPSISGDGRYVSFTSSATNLVPGDTNGYLDVFVRDRVKGMTTRISVSTTGKQMTKGPCLQRDLITAAGAGSTLFAGHIPTSSIGANGRFVVFGSDSSDLVAADQNGVNDVFVHDRTTRTTTRISVASGGSEAREDAERTDRPCRKGSSLTGSDSLWSTSHSISADGRYVVFASTATNLVPSDTNESLLSRGGEDIFVYDRKKDRTHRVTVEHHGAELDQVNASEPSISSNGRYISFSCWDCGPSSPAGDEPNSYEHSTVYVYDRITGAVDPGVAVSPRALSDAASELSSTGRYLVYEDQAIDENNPFDSRGIYLIDRGLDRGTGGIDEVRLAGSSASVAARFSRRGFVTVADLRGEVDAIGTGTDLVGLVLAHRPRYHDLWVRIEVDKLDAPRLDTSPAQGLTYGLSFAAAGRRYELRAAWTPSVRLGRSRPFALFRCSPTGCDKVADLAGGYGTVGEAVATAIPLRLLGLAHGGTISNVTAFSGHGTTTSGVLRVADRIEP